MLTQPFNLGIWVSLTLAGVAHAHIAAFHPAMYCANGTDPTANPNNNNDPVRPLYNLTYNDFWMHHSNKCDEFPPDEGVFLEIPAGGHFTVELAGNRAFTTLNTDPNRVLTDWGDGKNHPEDYSMTDLGGLSPSDSNCIPSPNLHTKNETMAAGTAFAIAYESDITKVTVKDLTVFTVRYHTPWKRVVQYDVPSGLPACPPGGCICVWGWIPNGCGLANMYMFPYRCNVTTDGTSPRTIGEPQPPVWCEEDPSKCVTGPKQILIWHQLDSNNIYVDGFDLSGQHKSPAYNAKCGFQDGAQNDIFVGSGSSVPASSAAASSVPGFLVSTPLPSGSSSSAPGPVSSASPGTSPLPTQNPASSLPGGPSSSSLPPVDPGASTFSAGPSASSLPPSDPASSQSGGFSPSSLPPSSPTASAFPTGSSTSSFPFDPASSGSYLSSLPPWGGPSCAPYPQPSTTGTVPASRFKRRKHHRRETHNVF